jgi:hypothetical protein
MDGFTRACACWIQNREQRPVQSRSWSPRVLSQADFWICCRGHQYASSPKRITTFGWIDLRERGRQSGAVVLIARAARDGSSLGWWEGVLGGGEDVGRCLTYIGKSLGFILGFRVGPWINRLVGANGSGKRECNRIEKRAMVRKPTGS